MKWFIKDCSEIEKNAIALDSSLSNYVRSAERLFDEFLCFDFVVQTKKAEGIKIYFPLIFGQFFSGSITVCRCNELQNKHNKYMSTESIEFEIKALLHQ